MKQKTHTVENNRMEGWGQEGNNAAVWNSMFNRNKGEKKKLSYKQTLRELSAAATRARTF